jgi:DNA polymerase III delta prime subunit
MLVGHQGVIEALSSQLPPVSIITGPPSVGKRMIAAYAAIKNNIARVDFTEVTKLTVDEAVRVKEFMAVKPMQTFRYAVIDLDKASDAAMDKLLLTLESPPSYAKFAMITSGKAPRTLQTRAARFTVGLLEPTELLTILVNKGIPVSQAKSLSRLGRVDLALSAYHDVASKNTALNVLNAVESDDRILLMQAYKAVDEKAANMIITAWEEAAAQSWRLFDPAALGVFAKRQVALKLLAAWSTMADARPQFAVRTVLESVMRG